MTEFCTYKFVLCHYSLLLPLQFHTCLTMDLFCMCVDDVFVA